MKCQWTNITRQQHQSRTEYRRGNKGDRRDQNGKCKTATKRRTGWCCCSIVGDAQDAQSKPPRRVDDARSTHTPAATAAEQSSQQADEMDLLQETAQTTQSEGKRTDSENI